MKCITWQVYATRESILISCTMESTHRHKGVAHKACVRIWISHSLIRITCSLPFSVWLPIESVFVPLNCSLMHAVCIYVCVSEVKCVNFLVVLIRARVL